MTFRHLLALADEGSLGRGRRYAAEGRVEVRSRGPHHVVAVATGTQEYDLSLDGSGGRCSCPIGMRTDFCKHLVALVLVAEGEVPETSTTTPETRASTAEPRRRTPLARDASALPPLVDSLRVRGHLDYERANHHGAEAHEVIDVLEASLSRSTADGMLPLLEKGIDHLTRAIGRSDDSSGIQSDAAARLFGLHEQAAALGDPDPRKLVRWMVRVGFAEHGFWEIDPVAYADALGERGLSAYRREVDRRLGADPEDFHPRRARQRLAVLDRDIPAIVVLIGRDLDRPHHFAALVDALIEIDARDQALDHALRGVTVAPVAHQTVPLYDVAVQLLTERGDSDQALQLRRQQLAAFPDGRSYASLRRSAQDSGVWEVERLVALDVLLEHNPGAWLRTLLAEGETDLAWDASRTMEVDATLDLQLLRERARTRPADVVDGYASRIRETLEPADQQAYRKGVALLGELRRTAVPAGRASDYEALVAELIETHRRRPTLRTMLLRMPPP